MKPGDHLQRSPSLNLEQIWSDSHGGWDPNTAVSSVCQSGDQFTPTLSGLLDTSFTDLLGNVKIIQTTIQKFKHGGQEKSLKFISEHDDGHREAKKIDEYKN